MQKKHHLSETMLRVEGCVCVCVCERACARMYDKSKNFFCGFQRRQFGGVGGGTEGLGWKCYKIWL